MGGGLEAFLSVGVLRVMSHTDKISSNRSNVEEQLATSILRCYVGKRLPGQPS